MKDYSNFEKRAQKMFDDIRIGYLCKHTNVKMEKLCPKLFFEDNIEHFGWVNKYQNEEYTYYIVLSRMVLPSKRRTRFTIGFCMANALAGILEENNSFEEIAGELDELFETGILTDSDKKQATDFEALLDFDPELYKKVLNANK